jgi:hypothetical protein
VHDPTLIRELEIGYAPGGNLRCHLMAQGHSLDLLRQVGLLNGNGSDAFYQRIVFPLRQGEHIVNLYGRSIGAAFAHRFLPGTKGDLYAWEKVRHCPQVILVEGLFDYAALRQAGFHNVTCSLGTHLNADLFLALCAGPRTVYLTFDVDPNQSAASPPAASSCHWGTIPTPFSSRAGTHDSSSLPSVASSSCDSYRKGTSETLQLSLRSAVVSALWLYVAKYRQRFKHFAEVLCARKICVSYWLIVSC